MSPAARRRLRILVPATAVVALLLAGASMLTAAGLACYVVSSPSMGTAAPVGSLVVTAPLGSRPAAPGEIVAFRPPGQPAAVYVHRVVGSSGTGLGTRGDANPESDAWTVKPSDVLGRAVAVLPGAGYGIRALPILLIGGVLTAFVTAPLRDPALRWAGRLIGGSAVWAFASVQVRPFTGLTIVTASPTPTGGVAAHVVSTGLLPIVVSGGRHPVELAPGASAQLLFETAADGIRLHVSPALDGWQWALAVAALLLPTGCSLLLVHAHRRGASSAT